MADGENTDNAFFLMSKTVEGVSSVRSYMRTGVPVLFDELRPATVGRGGTSLNS